MLGKVFEELVTGRHESGSYYTPKPIVSFMCREALKGHLAGKCPSESADALAAFVDDHDPGRLREPEPVLDALRTVVACDPACGSGAYLLGLLHELLDLRAALFAAGARDADRVYERKQQIIQNNLYGVDLDPFAVSIAQLRLWLSLAVEYDGPDPKPLPSLTFKIGVGDSLVAPDPSDGGQLSLQREVVRLFKEAKDIYGDPFADAASRHAALEKAKAYRDDLRTWLRGTGGPADGFDWAVEFAEAFAKEQPGFDVVLANPPYVRQELIKANKAAFKANFPDIYGGGADLCCYFYGRAIQLLRPGGVLAFISTNKWMRAEYGKRLRAFLGQRSTPNTILDFGHSPVFPAADTFPCLPVLTRKSADANGEDFNACPLPCDDYDPEMNVTAHVRDHAFRLRSDLMTEDRWLLERPEVHKLLGRLRDVGTPLRDFCGPPIYGIKSGLNEAFYVDDATRDRLVAESPAAAEVIRPLLRGRDVGRWRPTPSGQHLLLLRRSADLSRYPAIERHLTPFRRKLEMRAGNQAWYELQASPGDAAAEAMGRAKIVHQDIEYHSWFALEPVGAAINNTVFLLPTDDVSVLGVLNSPLMWWYLEKTLPHAKDEALRPFAFLMEKLPMTTGDADAAGRIGEASSELIALIDEQSAWERSFADEAVGVDVGQEDADRVIGWLPSTAKAFARNVAKLAAHDATDLPAIYKAGRSTLTDFLRRRLKIERRRASQVEDAWGMAQEERALLHATRPVRDPLDVLVSRLAKLGDAAAKRELALEVPED